MIVESDITGLSLSTDTTSTLAPIWRRKNLLWRSSTLKGPLYNGERGGTEASSQTKTKSAWSREFGRGLRAAEATWWGGGAERPDEANWIFLKKESGGNSGTLRNYAESRSINCFFWTKTSIFFRNSTKSQKNQRQMLKPVWTSCSSSESNLQASVEPFDHTISLGMIRGCSGHRDS